MLLLGGIAVVAMLDPALAHAAARHPGAWGRTSPLRRRPADGLPDEQDERRIRSTGWSRSAWSRHPAGQRRAGGGDPGLPRPTGSCCASTTSTERELLALDPSVPRAVAQGQRPAAALQRAGPVGGGRRRRGRDGARHQSSRALALVPLHEAGLRPRRLGLGARPVRSADGADRARDQARLARTGVLQAAARRAGRQAVPADQVQDDGRGSGAADGRAVRRERGLELAQARPRSRGSPASAGCCAIASLDELPQFWNIAQG